MEKLLEKIKNDLNNRKPAKMEVLDPGMLDDLTYLSEYMHSKAVEARYPADVYDLLNFILMNEYEETVMYDYYLKISTVGVFDLVIMFTVNDVSYEWIYRLSPDMKYAVMLNSCTEDLKIKYKDVPVPWFRNREGVDTTETSDTQSVPTV